MVDRVPGGGAEMVNVRSNRRAAEMSGSRRSDKTPQLSRLNLIYNMYFYHLYTPV